MKTWMVWAVLMLILVLMAGVAGAETTWVYPLGNGQTIDISKPCHDTGATALTLDDKLIQCHGKGWTQIQMICEQTILAAMEAMDEFIYLDGPTITDAVHRSPQAELLRQIEWMNRRDAARKLWTEAKACWRK